MTRAIVPVLALSLSGCLAYMPADRDPVHLEIRWKESFDEARKEAAADSKPILVVLVAGDRTGSC